MDRKVTLGLLVVLLVLGGYIWYNFWRADAPPVTPTTPEPTAILFVELIEDDVTALQVAGQPGQSVVHVTRAGDSWVMDQPLQGPADGSRVNELLFQISRITAERQLAPPSDLAAFGLKPPAAQVTVTLKDGKSSVLQLGRKNPDETSYYMLKSGDTNLYLVRAAVGDTILDLLKSPPYTPTPTATAGTPPASGTPGSAAPAPSATPPRSATPTLAATAAVKTTPSP